MSNKRQAPIRPRWPARLALWLALWPALWLALCAGSSELAYADPPPPAVATSSGTSPDPAAVRAALVNLEQAVKRAKGRLSAAVMEVEGGRVLAESHAELPLNPASNSKLFTAWAALQHHGAEHRYLTGLYGRMRGGRIERLVIRGDGDPSLEMRHLWELLERLRRAGLREVGDIVVDQSLFDGVYTPPAYDQQPNEWASFRAPVAALSLAGNTVMLEVRAGEAGKPAQVVAVPGSFVDLSGRVATTAPGVAEAVQLSLTPAGGRLKGTLGGSVPQGTPTMRIYKRVEDPDLLVGYGLLDVCRQLGIEVSGKVSAGPRRGEPLVSAHRSEPLANLLFPVGKQSNNFYAEMVFKGLSVGDGDGAGSFGRSSTLVTKLLDEHSIAHDGLRLTNGSGLFDANRVSAATVVRVLRAGYRDPSLRPELLAMLSIGGVDGTLRNRFRSQRRSRRVRAKTGTLAAVSALSGYVLGEGDRPTLAFSLLINDVRGSAAALRKDMDRFVSSLL